MKYLLILFFFIPITAYSQKKQIEIILKTDSTLTTKWIKMHDFPFLQSPYIKIHNLSGPKIKIRDINSYQGIDQKGNYRQLYKIDFGLKKEYRYTELMLRNNSSDNVKVYCNQLTFGSKANSTKICQSNYSINNTAFKKINYNNVKRDFLLLGYSNIKLKEANKIRVIQYFSIAIATGLFANLTYRNWNPGQEGFMDKESNLMFITSGLLYVFPFVLESSKKRKLVESLRNYK